MSGRGKGRGGGQRFYDRNRISADIEEISMNYQNVTNEAKT